ncbi:glucose 1-dehydrogenase [Halocatena halophila]|uniref:glucose 1-dehydrogenase n=1 Tax=Halocatena halophila TaxID=2814576 RepID=UPI002ED554DB
MKAIVVERGATTPTLRDLETPEPGPEELLLRTLRVGIDGTDFEVLNGSHGGFPADGDYQILGHEAIAVVEESNGTSFSAGDLVVPTVRRPPNGRYEQPPVWFDRGEPDMAPADEYVERGIVGAHGYMAEYFTSRPEFLVRIPDELAAHGFLVEPISNAEKALEHARASRSAFEWQPDSAFVLGNGPLGLLTLAMLHDNGFERTYCLGRRDRPDPTIEIIERLGSTYVDSRETPVGEFADTHPPVDFVYEATGFAKHAFESVYALAPNGVAALLGLPDDWSFEIDGGSLHSELVLQNKAILGSVNSNVAQYERAIKTLQAYPDWLPEALITDVFEPTAIEEAFAGGDDRIKTVIEFGER